MLCIFDRTRTQSFVHFYFKHVVQDGVSCTTGEVKRFKFYNLYCVLSIF